MAIMFKEPEAQVFWYKISDEEACRISAATLFEASMVAEGRLGPLKIDIAAWAATARMIVVPLDEEQARLAFEAWRKFGKGRHPAALNFGDCFSYALAKSLGEKLLFKGNDFSQTDIEAA